MGNCVIREKTVVQWGGEEWDLSSSHPEILFPTGKDHKSTARYYQTTDSKKEEETPEQREGDFASSYSNNKPTEKVKEVKIKITKKQLEELLSREVDVEGLSIQQVLLHQLMKASDHYETNLRSWRPNLKSIPE